MTSTAYAPDSSGPWQHARWAGPAQPEAAAPHAPCLVDRITAPYRTVTRFLERRALVRAARAVPRTLRFMRTPITSATTVGTVRASRHSLGLAIGVAADEAFLAMALAPSRFPRRADYTA